LGFTVKLKTDLTHGESQQAIENFLEKELPDADVALLYYSGHGVQIDGENYLVPVQEKVRDRNDLIHVDAIVQRIGKETKLTIVILDACRSGPGGSQNPKLAKGIRLAKIKGTAPGLAWMEAKQDVYIAYAAAPGQVAYAGTARLSPFTDALVQFLPTRGLELDDLLRRVRDEVKKATEGQQIPWSNSAMGKTDFFFKPRSRWPVFYFAALGLFSGIIASLAFAYFSRSWSDFLPGFLLGTMLASASFRWGNPPVKCLVGLAFAGLAWMMVVSAFEHTIDERSLTRSPDATSTGSAQSPAKPRLLLPTLTQKPLSAYGLETELKRTLGAKNFGQFTSQLVPHFNEVGLLWKAYMNLFLAVKRMLFGIVGSVLVFSCFAAPFPWLLRGQTLALSAGAGALASAVLGAVTLLTEPNTHLWGLIPWEDSLSGWAYQIPWQTSLAAVVGYALVNYVPDKPSLERSLFPAPPSWKPIAMLTLGGALVGGLASGLIAMNPEMSQFNQRLGVALPSGLFMIAGFAVFARASLQEGLNFAIFVFVAWVAGYAIGLGTSVLAHYLSIGVFLTFVTLAGAALVSAQFRQPGVWLVALLATAVTSVVFYFIDKSELDGNSKDVLLFAGLNLCASAAIGYGLSLSSPKVGRIRSGSRREKPA
jgi:hypothetical protein